MNRSLVIGGPIGVIAIASLLAYTGNIPTHWFQSPWDKLGHMALYGWLAVGLRHSLPSPSRWNRAALWAPLLLGLADELAQTVSAHRSPDVWDFLADATGIVIGYLV